jgi:hypothetical protein
VKTQMHTKFLIDLNVQRKLWIFFDRVQWTHLTIVPKVTPKGLLSYVQKKKFSPKINQDRVANNVFDLQNDFHEDRLSFPVYGEI